MQRLLIPATLTLLLTACGQSAAVDDHGAAPSTAVVVTETEAVAASDDPDPRDSEAPVAAAEADFSGADDLPGDPVVWADALNTRAELGVTGVEANDVLNVRAGPGPDQPIVDRLAPLHTGPRLTGGARMIGDAAWYEITSDGTTGWVNASFVDLVAGTTDITAEVRDGGATGAETMRDLAELVVRALGLDDGYRITWGPTTDPDIAAEAQRRVVISDGPNVGDVGAITLDVIDTFDDSVAAERLTIFTDPTDSGEGFSLRSVERTQFCDVTRGAGEVCA
jgi:hypothetical protein